MSKFFGFSTIISIFRTLMKKIRMSRYNNFTIAEYFRSLGAQIGDGCVFAIRDLGVEPYLIKIGNNVAVTKGVIFHPHDGGTWIFRDEMPDLRVFGPIIIKDNCLIGVNSQILPNVTIGPNSIVAAGSVVISDVPPNSIVMGVPARKFGSTQKYKEKCIERWAVQKPPNFGLDDVRHYEYLKNPEEALNKLRDHLEEVFKDELK